ncbi:MAG: insulinase family protein [Bacteroidetes bacterium]|nr:MAG: insulinase family protein [Bacteroidota bacterium]
MIDRTVAPHLSPLSGIDFIEPFKRPLGEHAHLFWMNQVPDETVKVELFFNAGTIRGKSALAGMVNGMLFGGTANWTSREIQEKLDDLGAYLDQEMSLEKAIVNVYCLKEHLREVMEIVYQAMHDAIFPEEEINLMVQEKKQRFQVSMEKVSFLARREFQQRLFEADPDYGRLTEAADFDLVSRDEMIAFHQEYYLKGLKRIVVVADIPEEEIEWLASRFEDWTHPAPLEYLDQVSAQGGSYEVKKEGAIQTAIRLGIPMFNKQHEDYLDVLILQTILGDYFGSRLMSNIREDKGYTYGVGSALIELNRVGYLIVVTEVASQVADDTLKEIRKEFERLQHEEVGAEELDLVKNYMVGQLLKSADGAGAMMDLFVGVERFGLDMSFYQNYLNRINSVQAEDIRRMAVKYLDWSNFIIIKAG